MSKAKQWGPWENVGPIGEGGMGHVFKVKNLESGEIGALKRLKNANRHERFKSEVEAVSSLQHSGIIQLLDANLEEEPYYAVYEYEPGGSLGDLKPEELLEIPLPQRLQLCEQVCDALHAAHKVSIIHRDIKPDNILISTDRTKVRLCDFGLVFVDDDERQTLTMEQVGSRYYIPPELEDGRASQVSAKSDIYSMGKVLYYIVAGKMFARERHRKEQYDLAEIHANPYLEVISKILDESITDDLGSRISSAAEMKTRIETARKSILARHPVQGVPETYRCVFCGVGLYEEVCISGEAACHNRGYVDGMMNNEHMVYLECNKCGNCQRFKLRIGENWFPESNARWLKTH